MQLSERIKQTIRDVKDYPKPGIVFKDITPVLAEPSLVREMVENMIVTIKEMEIEAIAAIEARGFIFGSILAHELNCKFIPIRKEGKLPYKTLSQKYDLEYGTAAIEIHEDALKAGSRVLIHDDLLATGGTAAATGRLIKDVGGVIAGFSFLINLSFLQGEENLRQLFGVQPQYLVNY